MLRLSRGKPLRKVSLVCFAIALPAILNAFDEDTCSKTKYKSAGPGDYTITTCVPVGKCVNPARAAASFADEAYCRAVATATCQKGHCVNYESTCYAHADNDNNGLAPNLTATGNRCNLSVGRRTIRGDECTVTIHVAAGGRLGCVCQCDQRVEIPEGAEKLGIVVNSKGAEEK